MRGGNTLEKPIWRSHILRWFRRPADERRRGGDTNYVRRNDYEKQHSKRDSCSIISGSVFYDSTATESTGSAGGSHQLSTGSSEDGEWSIRQLLSDKRCYNTGKVSTTAKTRSYIGGVAGRQEAFSKRKGKVLKAAICNYNTGKVTAGKKVVKGSIFGHYEVAGITAQAMVYNNYYKSGKAYGSTNLSWKPFLV